MAERTRTMTDHVNGGPGRELIATAIERLMGDQTPPTLVVGGYRAYRVRPTSIVVRATPQGPRVDIDGVGEYPASMEGGAPLNGVRIRVRSYCPQTRRAPKIEQVL